ncbi:hypothetical protein QBC35DRAFT_24503 [Podospora australis]|uniref:F-box domain-containing protein n=1 Tax=Podospora australis TaxID=1536484 RepID=A0AAN6X1J8_9PEZI|nr:hypothetical protein QBC35DRAFT_24503 [Podospora australis]
MDGAEMDPNPLESALMGVRACVNGQRWQQGMAQAVAGIDRCPCNKTGERQARHGKEKACQLSQYFAAIRTKKPETLLKVTADGRCSCGFAWPTCEQREHMELLDHLAECLLQQEQFIAALSTGLAMIGLHVSSAAGYCRVAKVLRQIRIKEKELQKAAAPNPRVERSIAAILKAFGPGAGQLSTVIATLIKYFVRTGLVLTGEQYRKRRMRDPFDHILQRMAHKLGLPAACRDPMVKLPLEIVYQVFSYLSADDIFRCVQVSKSWSRLINQKPAFWDDLYFHDFRRPPPIKRLAAFIRPRSQIKSLTIHEVARFDLSPDRLRIILFGLPHLKRLVLCTARENRVDDGVQLSWPKGARLSLTQLSVIGDILSKSMLTEIIEHGSDSLEALDLYTHHVARFDDLHLPKLKRLCISCKGRANLSYGPLATKPIVKATPNLEAFYIEGFPLAWNPRDQTTESPSGWPLLRLITLGSETSVPWRGRPCRFLPPFTTNIESIEILAQDTHLTHLYLFSAVTDDSEEVLHPYEHPDKFPFSTAFACLQNLKIFRCRTWVPSDLLRLFLDQSTQHQNLKVLELPVSRHIGYRSDHWSAIPDDPEELPGHPDAAFPWVTTASFASSLEHLGLYDFNYAHIGLQFGQRFSGDPFLEWLDHFPNVCAVSLYPSTWQGVCEEVAPFFGKLLAEKGQIKTVYQSILRGQDLMRLKQFAEERGKKLVHARNGDEPYGLAVFWDASGLTDWRQKGPKGIGVPSATVRYRLAS